MATGRVEDEDISTDDDLTGSEDIFSKSDSYVQRGLKTTMSLGLSVKGHSKISRETPPSVLSVSSDKSTNLTQRVMNFFSSNSEHAKCEEKLALSAAKIQNLYSELQKSQNENERYKKEINKLQERLQLENDTFRLKINEYEERIRKLKTEIDAKKTQQHEFVVTLNQTMGAFYKKLDSLDCIPLQTMKDCENIQVGSSNIQNVYTVELVGLNDLLIQYHDNLKSVLHKCEQARDSLRVSKHAEEQFAEEIAKLERVKEEMIEAVLEIKHSKKNDLATEVDYTVSLTDSRLMVACVEGLKTLPETTKRYTYRDLTGKAQIGVLRIYKKYGKLTVRRFIQRLEMEGVVDSSELTNLCLEKDDCASLLVRWVQIHEENNADALLEIFPRIKPGAVSNSNGRLYSSSNGSSYSISSSSDDLYQRRDLKERFVQEMQEFKDTFRRDIVTAIQSKLDELQPIASSGSEPCRVNDNLKNEPSTLSVHSIEGEHSLKEWFVKEMNGFKETFLCEITNVLETKLAGQDINHTKNKKEPEFV